MKKLSTLIIFTTISIFSFGQSQVGTVEYQKKDQPAATLELPYDQDIVTSALNNYMAKKGKAKGADLKGFNSFRNGALSDTNRADLYFKVDRKSRKEKNSTTISLLLGTPKEAVAPGTTIQYLTMEQAKSLLNEMIPAMEAANLEAQIKEQTTSVSKAESKYKSLLNDADDLQKKKASIEKKITENNDDQQKQTTEVETQKQKLAALIAQRKL